MKHSVLMALAWWLATFATGAPAQTTPTTQRSLSYLPSLAGDYFPINSKIVGRDYHIFVRLPEGYDKASPKQYPVVYLLDGDSLFPLLAPTHLFLTYDEKLPEAIVVGIAYGGFGSVNKRDTDFTAPAADASAVQGGALQFLAFLKSELLPVIESKFHADPTRRVLLGQSRGAYFVLWSALEDPDLFWGRIASNPGLGPGRPRFFGNAAPATVENLRVAVMSGTRDKKQRQIDARTWTEHWNTQTTKPWTVKLFPMESGTHAATIGESYRQAMLWLFDVSSQKP
jgi:predicted alpha/beta superfamily hydrolase